MHTMLSILLSIMLFAFHMSVFAVGFDVAAVAEDHDMVSEKAFYEDHARGWHWYERDVQSDYSKTEQKPESPDSSSAISYPATEELKKYQAQLEESKALAVMHPTPQNVLNYQKMQYEMTEKSGKFAEQWMKNVYANSGIDHTLISPTSQNTRHIYLIEQRKQVEQKITALSQEYGLFFFFKNDCAYCEAFAPTVKAFSEKYHWEVLAISRHGERHNVFHRSVQDNGLAETWGVNTYPSVFAVNPKTGHVIPVAVGMVSIQEMEERIIAIVKGEDHA